jgi:hypothetical protein
MLQVHFVAKDSPRIELFEKKIECSTEIELNVASRFILDKKKPCFCGPDLL